MNAFDRLRQYLEQRRELGETEFVLDGLSVEDALRALGMSGAASAGAASSAPSHPAAGRARPPAENAARRTAEKAGESGDWRAALRSVGVQDTRDGAAEGARNAVPPTPPPPSDAPSPEDHSAPLDMSEKKVGRYEMPNVKGGKKAAHPNAKPGLVVGSGTVEPMTGPLAKLKTLDAIAKTVAKCQACDLYATAKHPVPGEGNPDADFVVVGEAPGATEDETGRPFVGAAGQLLTKILGAVQLTREDVFICNVLKHRPPGNRNPAPDEITACSPYLLRQLELLQPKVILALGTFAAQTLLQTTQAIGKLRGQVHRFHGIPLIVTYHPAALLRNPSWKRSTWEDVQLARRILDHGAGGA